MNNITEVKNNCNLNTRFHVTNPFKAKQTTDVAFNQLKETGVNTIAPSQNHLWDYLSKATSFNNKVLKLDKKISGINNYLSHLQNTNQPFGTMKQSILSQSLLPIDLKTAITCALSQCKLTNKDFENNPFILLEIKNSNGDNILQSYLKYCKNKIEKFNKIRILYAENANQSNSNFAKILNNDSEIETILNQTKQPFQFACCYQIPERIQATDTQNIKWDIEKFQQLYDFWVQLVIEPKTQQQKALVLKKYHRLHFDLKGAIGKAIWIGCNKPSILNFADKKIAEDPYVFLNCQNKDHENIIKQLLNHYKSEIFIKRTLPEFSSFKNKYFNKRTSFELSQPNLANQVFGFVSLSKPTQEQLNFINQNRIKAFDQLPPFLKTILLELIYKHQQKMNPQEKYGPGYAEWFFYKKNPSIFEQTPSILEDCDRLLAYHINDGISQFEAEHDQQDSQNLNNINCTADFQLSDEKIIQRLPAQIRVAMVTAEFAGVVSKGGLSPAVAGMAGSYGKDNCVIILPKYDVINSNIKLEETEYVIRFANKINKVFTAKVNGFECYFIEDELFQVGTSFDNELKKDLPNNIYEGYGIVYKDVLPDTEKKWRFTRFSSLAAEFVYMLSIEPNHPVQLVHCHDAQTALVPELLIRRHYSEWKEGKTPATVLTFHNNNDQLNCNYNSGPGKNTHYLLEQIGLPGKDTNCLVQGIEAADMVTTVSKTFALEAMSERDGKGIQNTIKTKAAKGKLVGIVNGDNGNFNPMTNKPLKLWQTLSGEKVDLTFGPDDTDLPQKVMRIRQELCEYLQFHKLGILDPKKPILFYVGRFDSSQKGIDKLPLIMQTALDHDAQFICIGSDPDEKADKYLAKMEEIAKARNNHGICIIRDKKNAKDRYEWQQGRDPEKPQDWTSGDIQGCGPLMRAGIDLAVFPSLFEPCGLVQMEMFCMGEPVIATKTGGFANTVVVEGENKNGYLFPRTNGEWSKKDATGLQGEFIVLDDVFKATNEQDQCIVDTVAMAIKDAHTKLNSLYSENPEEQQRGVDQKRRIIRNGFNSTWNGNFYEQMSPIGAITRVYAKAIWEQQNRGAIFIDVHGWKYTTI